MKSNKKFSFSVTLATMKLLIKMGMSGRGCCFNLDMEKFCCVTVL